MKFLFKCFRVKYLIILSKKFVFKIPISHAEGRFYNDEETINNLIKIDQIILNTWLKMKL